MDGLLDLSKNQLIALNCAVGFIIVGLVACVLCPRLRDPALFVMIFGAVFIRKWMDITFGGIWWYRGTTRGFELSGIDLACWCLLGATLLAPRYRNHRVFFPAGAGLWGLYFLYCCWSVFQSDPAMYGVWELTKHFRALVILLTVALFIRTRRELFVMVLAFACSIWFLGLNAIEQRVVKHVLRPPATLDHENSLSMYLCMVTPVLVASVFADWPKWFRWLCGVSCIFSVIGSVLAVSRTGMPVLAFVMLGTAIFCTSWQLTRRRVLTVMSCVAVAGVLIVAAWDRISVRYTHSEGSVLSEFMGEDGFESRGEYKNLAKAIVEERPYGVGLNNWSYHTSKTYLSRTGIRYNEYDEIKAPLDRDAPSEVQPTFAPPAHSIYYLTVGELGIAGLTLLVLAFLRWLQMGASFLFGRLNPDPMHRLGIGLFFSGLGMMLHSVTEWTYRQTQLMFTFHVLMGALASLYYWKRQQKRAQKAALQHEEPEVVELEEIHIPVATARRQA
jgi:hypothetical protein